MNEICSRTFDKDAQASTNGCPDCGGRVRTNAVETVCDDCGLVIEDGPLDRGPEWRNFDDDERDSSRVGASLTATRHDRGLSTEIGFRWNGQGNRVSPETQRRLGRLRRLHSRATYDSKPNRNLASGFTEIRRICGALGLDTGFQEQACQLFRTAQSDNLIRGRSIESVATAAVYAVCRCNGLSRTLGEVTPLARVSRDRVEHAYSVLNREFGLPAEAVRPDAYLPHLASAVGLSTETERRARTFADVAHEAGIANGRKPSGVAAGCLYAAAQEHGEPVTQDALADAADVTAMTVRSRWREVRAANGIE